MNIQELQTISSEMLSIKIFVINNKSLGKIREIQENSYEMRMMATTENSGYTVPNFEKIALAYGIKSATIKSYDEIDSYTQWLKDKEPCLLNIELPDATTLQPKMNWNDREMKPLLSNEVMNKAKLILSME